MGNSAANLEVIAKCVGRRRTAHGIIQTMSMAFGISKVRFWFGITTSGNSSLFLECKSGDRGRRCPMANNSFVFGENKKRDLDRRREVAKLEAVYIW